VRDDRHGRTRRADADRRRRPVDGYRLRDRRRFERLVVDTMGTLPEELMVHLDGTQLVIEDLPPASEHGEGEVPLGTYRGPDAELGPDRRPLPQRVTVYRRPIEARATSRAEVVELVRLTVLHEVAHHLGIDDDRLDELGWG
jgi:predicted Zn-dependent protease with MMP-like domain